MRRLSAFQRFREQPSSIRRAAGALIAAALTVVVAGAVLVRVFDPEEYPTFGKALWFTLQTVTTVGYGDVTPTSAIGRTVAGFVMLAAFGLIAVVTATVTSVFVAAAQAEAHASQEQEAQDEAASSKRIEALLMSLHERLDRLEASLGTGTTERPNTDPAVDVT